MQGSSCEHCRWVRELGEPLCGAQAVLDDLRMELGLVNEPGKRRLVDGERAALEEKFRSLVEEAGIIARRQEAEARIRLADELNLQLIPLPEPDAIGRLTVVTLRCLTGCLGKRAS